MKCIQASKPYDGTKRSSKGCWATKLTFELIGLIVLGVLMSSDFTLTVIYNAMMDHGIHTRQVEKGVDYLEAPILPLVAINYLFVVVTWVHVASNARAFRRMTPGSARRRARMFVGIMCSIQVVVSMVGWLTDRTFVALGTLFLFVVIILSQRVPSL